MEGKKNGNRSQEEPVPVDYVTEDDDRTKRPEEANHIEEGKGQVEIMVKSLEG